MSKMNIPKGPTAGLSVSGTNARGPQLCGVAAMVGNDALRFTSYPVTTYAPADLHTKDLVLDSCLSGGYITFLRDEASCAYQVVGFDNSANYVPRGRPESRASWLGKV